MEPTKIKVRTNTIVGVALAILSIATVGAFLFNRFRLYRPGTPAPNPPATIGQTCTINSDCATGLICSSGTCTDPNSGTAGSPCDDIHDCATGLVCNIPEPGATGVCSNPSNPTSNTGVCAADLNCDGQINLTDLTALRQESGRGSNNNPCTNESPCRSDFDCDGDVDDTDLNFMRNAFNQTCSSGCGGSVNCNYPAAPTPAPGDIGNPCDDINDCITGLVCNIPEPGAAGICSAPVVTPTCSTNISANPISVTSGSASTISWSTTNATGCWGWVSDPNTGTEYNTFLTGMGQWIGPSGSGSSGSLTATRRFNIQCWNDNYDIGCPITSVNVNVSGGSVVPPTTTPCSNTSYTRCPDGRCYNLQNDPNHCGRCDRACATGASCVNGSCICPTGQNPCNGACVDITTDEDNCGGCSRSCADGQLCTSGICINPTQNCSINITAPSYPIQNNSSTVIRWDSTNAVSCRGWRYDNRTNPLSYPGDGRFLVSFNSGRAGNIPIDGSGSTDNLTSQKVFEIECDNGNGRTCRAWSTVQVR